MGIASKLSPEYRRNILDVSDVKSASEFSVKLEQELPEGTKGLIYVLAIDEVPVNVGETSASNLSSRARILFSDMYEVSHNKFIVTRLALLDAKEGNSKIEKFVIPLPQEKVTGGMIKKVEKAVQNQLGFHETDTNENIIRSLVQKRLSSIRSHIGNHVYAEIFSSKFISTVVSIAQTASNTEIIQIKQVIAEHPEWKLAFELLFGYKSDKGVTVTTSDKKGDLTGRNIKASAGGTRYLTNPDVEPRKPGESQQAYKARERSTKVKSLSDFPKQLSLFEIKELIQKTILEELEKKRKNPKVK